MYILIDIGGTNTRIALTKDKETFGEPVIFATPEHFDDWFNKAIRIIDELREGAQLNSIIVGMAGTFSSDRTTINVSPHLPKWNGTNLHEKLGGWFNCKTHVENDTAMVGLGEAVFGSGKNYDIVVYITISTGVGGIRIINGEVDKSKFGFEIGHQIITADGKEIEYYLAGSSHETRMGMPSKDIKDKEFWKEVNYYAGILTANTTMYWSPAIIIFGGPVSKDIDWSEVENTAKKFTPMYQNLPSIARSSLGDLGGIYGALALSKKL